MKNRYRPEPVGLNFVRLSPTGPRTTLLCFPAAGAGAQAFRPWAPLFSGRASLLAVRAAGREDRIAEPAPADLTALAGELAGEITDNLPADEDLVFFGTCLGAVLCFEVARALRAAARPTPRRLLIVGDAPSSPREPVADLRAEMLRTRGLSQAVLDEPDVYSIFEKALRGDFGLASGYRYSPQPPLPMPFDLFADTDQPEAEVAAVVEGWSRETRAAVTVTRTPLDPNGGTSGRLAELALAACTGNPAETGGSNPPVGAH